MNDRKIILMPGSTYNEHVEHQYIFPGLRQVENNNFATAPEEPAPAPGTATPEATELCPPQPHPISFARLVSCPDKAEAVIRTLHELMDGQNLPKDIVMPVRAAMEAGAIRRPTWAEFCAEFGHGKLKSKSSLSKYTEKSYRFDDEAFQVTIEKFKSLIG